MSGTVGCFPSLEGCMATFGTMKSCPQGAQSFRSVPDQVLRVLCPKLLLRTGEIVFPREESTVGYPIPSPQP